MNIDSKFAGKRFVKIFSATPECPLRLRQRVVLSCVYDRWQQGWSISERMVSRVTGVSRKTVRQYFQEFADAGVFNPHQGKVVIPSKWYFKSGDGFAWWPLIVRVQADGVPMTFEANALYCFWRNCIRTKFKPSGGFTNKYFANALGIDVSTVNVAIDNLRDVGLLKKGLCNPSEKNLHWWVDVEKKDGKFDGFSFLEDDENEDDLGNPLISTPEQRAADLIALGIPERDAKSWAGRFPNEVQPDGVAWGTLLGRLRQIPPEHRLGAIEGEFKKADNYNRAPGAPDMYARKKPAPKKKKVSRQKQIKIDEAKQFMMGAAPGVYDLADKLLSWEDDEVIQAYGMAALDYGNGSAANFGMNAPHEILKLAKQQMQNQ